MPRPSFRFNKFWTFYPRLWNLIRVVWKIQIRGDMRYRMTRRLELARWRLLQWNQLEVSDIFRHIEMVTDIVDLRRREDQQGSPGGCPEGATLQPLIAPLFTKTIGDSIKIKVKGTIDQWEWSKYHILSPIYYNSKIGQPNKAAERGQWHNGDW